MAGHPPHDKPDNGNAQVIALLNALGARLIASENERTQLKQALSDLEARADQSERIFLTLQDRQSKIESQNQTQREQLTDTAQMAARIEEALNQQARLTRRLEKMHQERVQMSRKIERLEESVIETQEALHSKALVLLTDQNVAGQSGKPTLTAAGKLPVPPPVNDDQAPFWQNRIILRSLATASVIILGAFCGWALYGTHSTPLTKAPFDLAAEHHDLPAVIPAAAPEEIITTPADAALNDLELAALSNSLLHESDSILQEKFAQDPDALAAALNMIAPAAIPSAAEAVREDKPETTAKNTPETSTEQSASAPPATPIATKTTIPENRAFDSFIAGVKKTLPPLSARIQPDPALPPAIQAMERKAFDGAAEAQHDLAAIYTAGHGGVKKDYSRAAAWFTEAALQNIANARYNLGVLYHQGLGVEKDMNLAINWYGAAAALNHPEAQYNLGIAHIEGIGTAYDPQAAATYFENAARQNILEAAYNLGLIHENGLLGSINPERALYWYQYAAERGSPEARAAREQLAKSLGLTPAETEKYIGKAAAEIIPAPTSSTAPPPAASIKESRKESRIESLLPEDKIDIAEIASYIPRVDDPSLFTAVSLQDKNSRDKHSDDKNNSAKNHALIAQIQEQLVRLGLYPGPADGKSGPQTEDAIRTYQTAHHLPNDGRASEALLLHLLTNEDERSSRAE